MVVEGFSTTNGTKASTSRLVLLCCALGLLVLVIFNDCRGIDANVPPGLRVFGAFWESGHAALHGLNPFAAYPMTQKTAQGMVPDINLSPPALLPLFAILALFDPRQMIVPWILAQAIAFIAGMYLLVRTSRAEVALIPLCWMFFCTQTSDGFALAQDYPSLFAVCACAWAALASGRMRLAGILIGLFCAAKPNWLLWPGLLLLAGYALPALVAAATFAVASTLPILLFGTGIYRQYGAAVAADRHWMVSTDVTLHGLAERAGMPFAGTVLVLGLVAGAALLTIVKRPSVLQASLLALAVGVPAAPVAWPDYAIFLFPGLVFGLWGKLTYPAMALFSIPTFFLMQHSYGGRVAYLGVGLLAMAPFFMVAFSPDWLRATGGQNAVFPDRHRKTVLAEPPPETSA